MSQYATQSEFGASLRYAEVPPLLKAERRWLSGVVVRCLSPLLSTKLNRRVVLVRFTSFHGQAVREKDEVLCGCHGNRGVPGVPGLPEWLLRRREEERPQSDGEGGSGDRGWVGSLKAGVGEVSGGLAASVQQRNGAFFGSAQSLCIVSDLLKMIKIHKSFIAPVV